MRIGLGQPAVWNPEEQFYGENAIIGWYSMQQSGGGLPKPGFDQVVATSQGTLTAAEYYMLHPEAAQSNAGAAAPLGIPILYWLIGGGVLLVAIGGSK